MKARTIIEAQKNEQHHTRQHQCICDLGLENTEERLVKAQFARKIGDIIKRRKLTQVQASELLGISQPKLSGMLRGQFRGISETKMLECLTRLGRDIQIVVKTTPRSRTEGHVSVIFA